MKAEASSLFSRREIMGSAAAATLLAFGAGAARAAPAAPAVSATPATGMLREADPQAVMKAASTGQMVFDIAWTDIVGGTLVSRFETVGDEIRAFTNIDASYYIFWMPAIDYHLAVRETWRGWPPCGVRKRYPRQGPARIGARAGGRRRFRGHWPQGQADGARRHHSRHLLEPGNCHP